MASIMYSANIYRDTPYTCSILVSPGNGDPMYMYPLQLTGALPYLAVIPILLKPLNWFTRVYLNTILISTTLGILWHSLSEPEGMIKFADYYAAFCWLVLDLLWCKIFNNPDIIIYNIDTIIIHCLIDLFIDKKSFNYIMYHSAWHVLFAMKSVYVSCIIWKYDRFTDS